MTQPLPSHAALKTLYRPCNTKCDKKYQQEKDIFINDAKVLHAIQGHPNIVKLIEVIPCNKIKI